MPGEYLVDQYDERRIAMERAAFPTLAAKKGAFRRLFGKLERLVGRTDAMRVLVEGNYLAEESGAAGSRRPRPELIARLITAHIAG